MNKRKQIKVRDKTGKLFVILETESTDPTTGAKQPRLELPNRAEVKRMSSTEFRVVQTGHILTQA